MSIEDTANLASQPSPEALAAARAVVAGKLPGLRYDAAPEPDSSPSTDSASPGLAEAARRFLEDYPNSPEAPPRKPTLVSDRDAAELAQLEVARQNAINDLEQAIAQADDESKPELKAALQNLKDAKTPGDISAALTSATSKLSAEAAGSGSKAAGGDAERQQLWGEIGKLNNKVGNIMQPHMSEEERQKDEEYRERIRNARTEEERLAIQREYTRWRQQVVDDWRQSGDPEKEKAADQAQPGLDEIKKREEEILRNRRQTREGNAVIKGTASVEATAHVGRTQERSGIIASDEANIASLGELPSGTNATTARRPSGGPLERV